MIPGLTGGRGGSVGPAQGIVTYGSDSGHGIKDAPEWTLVDEAIKNLGYMQMKKTHDAAMVLIERMYGAQASSQLLHRHVAGRPRSAHRRPALSRRLRRHHRQRAHRQLLVADARAWADPNSGEAARQLGDPRQGERHPRRVHAAVRRPRWPCRRDHQQLHGVPRHLRREAGRQRPQALGLEAVSEQRRSRIRPTRRQPPASPTGRSRRSSSSTVATRLPRRSPTASGPSGCGCQTPIRPAAG